MFAIRQIWKCASYNILQKPSLATSNLVSYFGRSSSSSVVNSSLYSNARSLVHCKNYAFNVRSGLLEVGNANQTNQERSVTQYSLHNGKRRTVRNVLKRFYRLDWGIWIRTKCGRTKKMYKKSSARKRRLKEHVFCNAQQSNLLDKMVTKFWKQPKYFVDDPYEPYYKREEFQFTRKKPLIKDN